jgi:hypothetical protein
VADMESLLQENSDSGLVQENYVRSLPTKDRKGLSIVTIHTVQTRIKSIGILSVSN